MIFGPRKTASMSMEIPDLDLKIKAWKVLAPKAFDKGLEAGVRAAAITVQDKTKHFLSGEVLNRRSGDLKRSIHSEVFRRNRTIVGIVGTGMEYAAIHEFGGIIRPKDEGGRLAFKIGGDMVFAKSVEIPKRPYLSRAFNEEKAKVKRLIQEYVMRSVKGMLETGKVVPPSQRRAVGFDAN